MTHNQLISLTKYLVDSPPRGKFWTGWSNWYGCHGMDADKWDDFPDNFVAADGARIRQASNKNGDLFDNTNVNSESNGFEVHKN